jgi:sugar lactone lactonase YvrE
LTGETVVGSNFAWRVNQATFMLGPTGIALGNNGSLYVAQTLSNRITVIPDALTRTSPVADGTRTLSSGGFLNAPLGMTIAPNGDVVVMNGNDGNAVEITPHGRQIAKVTLVKNGAGALFGLAITGQGRLMFVNDASNALDVAS